MVNKKPEVVAALKTIILAEGSVTYDRPAKFKKLPHISYYETNNSPEGYADDTEYSTEVNIAVDIWAALSGEADSLALEVDAAMTRIMFTREFSRDVPDPDPAIRHKTMRFQYIGG